MFSIYPQSVSNFSSFSGKREPLVNRWNMPCTRVGKYCRQGRKGFSVYSELYFLAHILCQKLIGHFVDKIRACSIQGSATSGHVDAKQSLARIRAKWTRAVWGESERHATVGSSVWNLSKTRCWRNGKFLKQDGGVTEGISTRYFYGTVLKWEEKCFSASSWKAPSWCFLRALEKA